MELIDFRGFTGGFKKGHTLKSFKIGFGTPEPKLMWGTDHFHVDDAGGGDDDGDVHPHVD